MKGVNTESDDKGPQPSSWLRCKNGRYGKYIGAFFSTRSGGANFMNNNSFYCYSIEDNNMFDVSLKTMLNIIT